MLVSQQRVHAQVPILTDAQVVLVCSLLVFCAMLNVAKAFTHGPCSICRLLWD